MEKKMFFAVSDNGDLSNLYLVDMADVTEFIENEIQNIENEHLFDWEWTIKPVFMTQDEFDNLPEYQF